MIRKLKSTDKRLSHRLVEYVAELIEKESTGAIREMNVFNLPSFSRQFPN